METKSDLVVEKYCDGSVSSAGAVDCGPRGRGGAGGVVCMIGGMAAEECTT